MRLQVEEGHNDCLEVLVASGADLNARSEPLPASCVFFFQESAHGFFCCFS